MSYLTCTNCGQKALSVATRCPHCGRPFGSRPLRYTASRSKQSRIPLGLLIIGAVVIVLVVIAVRPRFSVAPPATPPATPIAPAPPSRQAPNESLAATVESVRAVPATPAQSPSELPASMADSAVPVAPAPTPEPLGTVAAQRRYASTWTNVRADRSNTAPVIRILRPGEVVQVDSLKQGWYRLVTDEQATGYVDQRYLDTLPPGPP